MEEIWVTIPQFPMYEVSIHGRVRSIDRYVNVKASRLHPAKMAFRRGKVLKLGMSRDGYTVVNLTSHKRNSVGVHRLIMMGFVPNPNNYKEVNHINGIKNDNRIENLEWCTRSQNQIHAFRTGLQLPKKGGYHFSKLDVTQVLTIRKCLADGMKCKDIAPYFKIHVSAVSGIKNRRTWLNV